MHHTHTPLMHTHNTYLPHSRISIHPNRRSPIISTESVAIPARTNTIMTTPCALPHSKNCLFKPLQQHFVDQQVQYTPVMINAENDNLSVHFINHSNHEVVIPKDSYVEVMEEVQESEQDISHTNTSPKPVSKHTLSNCLAQSDLCPTNINHCIMFFRKTLVSLDPVLLTSPVPPSSNTISILATLNLSNRA